jgi:4a-hydroxytetrahydrobiopterin dehydratase
MAETPKKLTRAQIDEFLASHQGWKVENEGLEKTYTFQYYGACIAFAVHIGFAADKRDHHPDLHITWGKVEVRWSTHDAGGITALDVELAQIGDHAYGR